MGLSFDDKRSLEVTGSLHFASDGPSLNSIQEIETIGRAEWKDSEIDGSEDIQVMGLNGSIIHIQSNQIT